jgi:hypothetical protein
VKEAGTASQLSSFTESLGLELQSFLKTQSSKEAIDLLEKQMVVISRRIEHSHCDEQRRQFQEALQKLEDQSDNLVMPKYLL